MKFIVKIKSLIASLFHYNKETSNKNENWGTKLRTPTINIRDDSESLDLTEEQISELLLRHPIFTELREWAEYRSKILSIDNRLKRNMAKYYLQMLFKELKEAMQRIVTEHNVYLEDSVALNNLLIDTINRVHQTALQYGTPEIFLNKFSHYLYTQLRILDSTYRDLDKFELYRSKLARVTFRLDLEFLTLRNITSEIETVINDMNGKLEAALEGSIFVA